MHGIFTLNQKCFFFGGGGDFGGPVTEGGHTKKVGDHCIRGYVISGVR